VLGRQIYLCVGFILFVVFLFIFIILWSRDLAINAHVILLGFIVELFLFDLIFECVFELAHPVLLASSRAILRCISLLSLLERGWGRRGRRSRTAQGGCPAGRYELLVGVCWSLGHICKKLIVLLLIFPLHNMGNDERKVGKVSSNDFLLKKFGRKKGGMELKAIFEFRVPRMSSTTVLQLACVLLSHKV
jgi:hypothetical protein